MSENVSDGLRQLPAVNEILALPEVARLCAERGRESVRDWARAAVDDLRRRLAAGSRNGAASRDELTGLVVEAVCRQACDESSGRFGCVINATGVILHTSLGRAPLCAAAVAAHREAAA